MIDFEELLIAIELEAFFQDAKDRMRRGEPSSQMEMLKNTLYGCFGEYAMEAVYFNTEGGHS